MSCAADRNHNGLPHARNTSQSIPTPMFKTEADPYPTTFVQADRMAFKQVVQLLTGTSETAKQASNSIRASLPDPSPKVVAHHEEQGPKLYQRRNNNLKNRLVLNTVAHRAAYYKNDGGFSLATPEVLSPSMLDFPRLALSPVTPLTEDLFHKSSTYSEEEKAISQKKFYLHPSPRTTPRNAELKLLQLFPSPRD